MAKPKLEFMLFASDRRKTPNIIIQLVSELFFSILYFLAIFVGIFTPVPKYVKGKKRTVVLVCGFLGRPITWLRMRARLIKMGYSVYTMSLGFQVGSIEKKSIKLQDYLEKNNLNDVYLVCHSMGGLIAVNMGYKGRDRVRSFITLGTPFGGTWLAIFAPFFNGVRQMIPSGPFIKKIRNMTSTISNLQGVFGSWDQIVLSQNRSRPGHFDDIKIDEIGHFNLAMGASAIECTLELLEKKEIKDPLPEKEAK